MFFFVGKEGAEVQYKKAEHRTGLERDKCYIQCAQMGGWGGVQILDHALRQWCQTPANPNLMYKKQIMNESPCIALTHCWFKTSGESVLWGSAKALRPLGSIAVGLLLNTAHMLGALHEFHFKLNQVRFFSRAWKTQQVSENNCVEPLYYKILMI